MPGSVCIWPYRITSGHGNPAYWIFSNTLFFRNCSWIIGGRLSTNFSKTENTSFMGLAAWCGLWELEAAMRSLGPAAMGLAASCGPSELEAAAGLLGLAATVGSFGGPDPGQGSPMKGIHEPTKMKLATILGSPGDHQIKSIMLSQHYGNLGCGLADRFWWWTPPVVDESWSRAQSRMNPTWDPML